MTISYTEKDKLYAATRIWFFPLQNLMLIRLVCRIAQWCNNYVQLVGGTICISWRLMVPVMSSFELVFWILLAQQWEGLVARVCRNECSLLAIVGK